MNEPVSTERRSRWWLAAAVPAGLLVAAATLGVLRPGGFVIFGSLNRPFLFGTAALVLLALAAWLGLRDRIWRLVVSALLVMVAVGWAALGWAASALSSDNLTELSRHPAPGGDRVLVLYRGQNIIDPTWELRLRSGSGATAREWDLGCVNGDLDSLTRVEWTGQDALRVHLSRGRQVDIVLDGATGSPHTKVSVGC